MASKFEYWSKRLEMSESLILPGNYRHLKRHLRKLESGGISTRTITNHIQVLMPFSIWCKSSFESLIEDDIFDYCEYISRKTYKFGKTDKKYSPATLYNHKTCIKTFLKPINKEAADSISLKKNRRTLPEVLNERDIMLMIKAARNSRDRALLAFLFESGARKGEMRAIQIKNVTFDDVGVVVVLPQGKTGARRIRLVFSASYIREWVCNDHPTKDDRESIVFCALRSPYPPISDTGLHIQLRKIAGWAGVKKRVNAHSFRHAAATHFAKLMTEQEMKVYFGWTGGSDMPATYVHLSGEDLDDSILQIHGLKSSNRDNSLTVTHCPRCKDIIPENSMYCSRCGLPLQDSAKQKIESDIAEIDLEIIKAALLNPAILEEIAKRVKQNETTG